MTVLAIVDTVLLAIALVYIVALLRSHADILRRLSLLEEAGGSPAAAGSGDAALPSLAADVHGVTLAGDAARLPLGSGGAPTLVAFLTSGCASCRPFWDELADTGALAALDVDVAIVTHDAARESATRLRELAPPGVELIMASSAWSDYRVPSSPHFVLADGAGGIAGRGSALGWEQLVALVSDARADANADGIRVRTTRERAERAEHALERAGITAGHPSLYPSRDDGTARPGEAG